MAVDVFFLGPLISNRVLRFPAQDYHPLGRSESRLKAFFFRRVEISRSESLVV